MPRPEVTRKPILDALIAAVETEIERVKRDGYSPREIVLPLTYKDRLALEATARKRAPRVRSIGKIAGIPVRYEHCATRPSLFAHHKAPILQIQMIIDD